MPFMYMDDIGPRGAPASERAPRSTRTGRFINPTKGEPLIQRQHRTPQRVFLMHCLVCGEEFPAHRRTRKYCSVECNQKSWRERHQGSADMVGIKGEALRMYTWLQEKRPRLAERCELHYAMHGKDSTVDLLEILRSMATGKTQPEGERRGGLLGRVLHR